MTFDPFADTAEPAAPAPTQEPWDEAPAPASTTPPDSDVHRVRITLKGGSGHDSPWVTIDGANIEDARAQIADKEALKALLDDVAKAGAYFARLGNGGSRLNMNGKPASQQRPPHQQAPGGQQRYCEHGPMVYKSGVGRNGKPWKAFDCPNSTCDRQWVN
ncbi:hypothetical protein GCM10012275_07750 [Longimycelium tulufanense]|uniref:Uncharacterized protein n=1 Tax=Longimycelium tulufanense TaxID=907463 RepID=A0A8J3CAI0_9PSEU|nr:hypothetical protein [Longimycelium tulufanense]GGM39287.1 hypothetical protein GCM10012275_07750 [Longimycelium tulufanense]